MWTKVQQFRENRDQISKFDHLINFFVSEHWPIKFRGLLALHLGFPKMAKYLGQSSKTRKLSGIKF